MLLQNSNLQRKKIRAYRKFFVLTFFCTAFFACFHFAPSSEAASGTAINLLNLQFYYLKDGSIVIELIADSPAIDYQIQTIADKTIVQIKGANFKLYPSYLVRNAFDVQVKPVAKYFDGEPGTELTIFKPAEAIVSSVKESNKIYFLISFNKEILTKEFQPALISKEILTNNFQPVAKNRVITSVGEPQPSVQKSETVLSIMEQQGNGAISGQVKDGLGGVIVDAEVVITDQMGRQKVTKTNQDGIYRFTDLSPGKYVLKVNAPGFAEYESKEIEITNKFYGAFDIGLKVSIETQVVTVDTETRLSSEPENNANGIVLRGEELNSLPDDAPGLATALQGLAAASGNQFGTQVIIDGFTGSRIPPKKSIQEIKINKNPYSAEFNRPGNGRIEILTKPGMDEFSGGGFFGFNSDRLNTRDPFAVKALPYQSNNYGFYLGGPIKAKRASFFFNFEKGKTDSVNLINAKVLDSNVAIVPLNLPVSSPNSYLNFTPRIDLKLDERNTLSGRYYYSNWDSKNSGVGGFSLLSRAYKTSQNEQAIQIAETAVINPRFVTETRSQFIRRLSSREPGNVGSTIDVPGAFTDGLSFQRSFNEYRKTEASSVATLSLAKHTIRTGGGFRYIDVTDFSASNSGGTFRFDGAFAPQLNGKNEFVYDSNGNTIVVPISGLERYRRTILFSRLGKTPQEIRTLGGGASQFSITNGNREASVRQHSLNAFIQDDWRLQPNFTLSLGLRFESQSSLSKNLNFAPRLSFAWSKARGGNQSSKNKKGDAINFVLRGGIGLFYEELSENFTLRANRLNGLNQRQYIVTEPSVLDLFPQIPEEAFLKEFSAVPTVVGIDPKLRSPLSIQSTINFEKQLPYKLVLSANYLNVRMINALRTRYISASSAESAVNKIFQYESTGKLNQNQLSFTISRRLGKSSFYATYSLNKVHGNTDGADFIPFLENDYSRVPTDVRHSFYFGGWLRAFGGVDINPVIFYRSGVPFDIVLGRDLNGDSILNDRPSFATELNRPSVVVTSYGAFDLEPQPGQVVIPRNYGVSPGFLSANLNISKTFTFFDGAKSETNNERFSLLGIQLPRQKIYLTLSVQIENLFNWTNPSFPEGNLSSPLFGQSYFSAGNYGFGTNTIGNRVIKPYISFGF